ncbi:O-antigen ligase family protein [Ramlibacter sp.]|uniref:O-antigen ligase family protein n=1 Tax=Ramlibacter sp. TaxID=1917967 RepID=UPI002B66CC4B|nr:O-antigen ligase family protein [Ramlibacter sp.]HWI82969.1 O-antigen ligase family protein [Ramlibacter sp.]
MARRRPHSGAARAAAAAAAGPAPAPVESGPTAGLPPEAGSRAIVPILALMMLLAPALGVPREEMLQDTLKSIVVSAATLGAALLFFARIAGDRPAVRWHGAVWLPLLLLVYALGSMAWSHTFLAGVEAVRWFVFGLLMWLGLNTLSRPSLPLLAWGIHAGGFMAALWAVLQFWVDLRLFPQGPHPASTFVNRNFFAEFAVCTVPFAAILLARARQSAQAVLLAASAAVVIVAIMMTGTRAALAALWLQVLVLLPWLAWRYRRQFAFAGWSRGLQALVALTLVGGVLAMGAIPTGDAKIVEEQRGATALERGLKRTASISPDDPSLGIRQVMWRATARIIAAHPLAGVGAGAWENEVPLYQERGAQLETDYYVHNEYLQLLAEYGLVGWVFLLALAGWLVATAWRTLRARTEAELAEAPWRALLLTSLLTLFVVSNVGFPWRMASTGALFALCLGALAASDARLGLARRWAAAAVRWRPQWSQAAAAAVVTSLALTAFISWRAAEAEFKIVRATRIALSISASGDPNDPRWAPAKAQMLQLIRQGIAINPHYRKITPMVADELARWGDWQNAIWIWESVLSSRPHIVAIMANVARGYASTGQLDQAMAYLERAKRIQPSAPSVRSLEVILLSRTGQTGRALALGRLAIDDELYDYDLASTTFLLAWKAGDWELARRAMRLRMVGWPGTRAEGYLQLATMYDQGMHEPEQALGAYRQALALVSGPQREALASRIPAAYAARLGLAGGAAPAPQRSASNG